MLKKLAVLTLVIFLFTIIYVNFVSAINTTINKTIVNESFGNESLGTNETEINAPLPVNNTNITQSINETTETNEAVSLNQTVNETENSIPDQKTSEPQFEEIGEGLFYNIRSSIFKWFQKTVESINFLFVEDASTNISKGNFTENVTRIDEDITFILIRNIKLYEAEREKNREYLIKRNENLRKSLERNDEPPFDYAICSYRDDYTGKIRSTFCSCGDGVCASYEDKCKCPRDCGFCPEGTVCKRGECVGYIENTCMNNVCEEGENETCPWDCKVYMQEEEEEVLSEEEKRKVAERIREGRIAFFRSHGVSEEEVEKALKDIEKEQNKTEEITLPEEP